MKDEAWKATEFEFVLPASKEAPCVWIANSKQKEGSVRMFTQCLAVLQANACELHVATPGKLLRCLRQLCARNCATLEQLIANRRCAETIRTTRRAKKRYNDVGLLRPQQILKQSSADALPPHGPRPSALTPRLGQPSRIRVNHAVRNH